VVSAQEGDLEDVLCYSGWWDCPRSGVAVIDGSPHFFDCRFSDELDDYPVLYEIWPARDEELADALEAFREFAAWRDLWDCGQDGRPRMAPRSQPLVRRQQTKPQGPLELQLASPYGA